MAAPVTAVPVIGEGHSLATPATAREVNGKEATEGEVVAVDGSTPLPSTSEPAVATAVEDQDDAGTRSNRGAKMVYKLTHMVRACTYAPA